MCVCVCVCERERERDFNILCIVCIKSHYIVLDNTSNTFPCICNRSIEEIFNCYISVSQCYVHFRDTAVLFIFYIYGQSNEASLFSGPYIALDKTTMHTKCTVSDDLRTLRNSTQRGSGSGERRLKKYTGVIGDITLPIEGRNYFEVEVEFTLKQVLEEKCVGTLNLQGILHQSLQLPTQNQFQRSIFHHFP